jgi:aminopeptidase N
MASTLFFYGQNVQQTFGRADSLRGFLFPERSSYDVLFYDLEVKILPEMRRIAGSNLIRFRVLRNTDRIQIDLFENMQIARILYEGKELPFQREFNAVFIDFPQQLQRDGIQEIRVFFGGTPQEAVNPPWDGGFVWEKDKNGKDWVGVACEGLGASMWWPLKDHPSDEPDSMRISLIIPDGLMAVSNGELTGFTRLPGNFNHFEWFVGYPINAYNVTVNIGDYTHLEEQYANQSGDHPLDYYVLTYNREKALKHFEQVKDMLRCFESFFGEYPFWEDGYALVETSYWGMEHQGAISYGNEFKNNEYGFDYIIVHESGHEWFGNSLSAADHADLWIHESFTTYSEALFVECMRDYETALTYLAGQRKLILNREKIVGPPDVNYNNWSDADMYYKGTWMLQSLRHTVADDSKWFRALKAFAEKNRMKTLNTVQVVNFFNRELEKDYSWLFDQFLNHPDIPLLEYRLEIRRRKAFLSYRWNAAATGFSMPVDVSVKDREMRLYPDSEWKEIELRKGSERSLAFDMRTALFNVREIIE